MVAGPRPCTIVRSIPVFISCFHLLVDSHVSFFCGVCKVWLSLIYILKLKLTTNTFTDNAQIMITVFIRYFLLAVPFGSSFLGFYC